LAGPYLLDLNPRSFASLALALEAGVNLIGLYCDLLMGEAPTVARARPGVFYRWLDADVRHALAQVRSRRMSLGEAARILRPRRHTARGGPESLRDPGPLLARLGYVASTAWARRRRQGELGHRDGAEQPD